ncbi:hypothetical protein ES702_06741 [subsurface metagenome]
MIENFLGGPAVGFSLDSWASGCGCPLTYRSHRERKEK